MGGYSTGAFHTRKLFTPITTGFFPRVGFLIRGIRIPQSFPDHKKKRSALGLLNDAAFISPQDFTDQKGDVGPKGAKFTRDHRGHRLIYFEGPHPIDEALKRERQLKRWSQVKKLALIQNQTAPLRQLSRSREKRRS